MNLLILLSLFGNFETSVSVQSFGKNACGCGVVVNENGYILTASHVINNNKLVIVNGKYKAKIIFDVPANDIAIIKIDIKTKYTKISKLNVNRALIIGNPKCSGLTYCHGNVGKTTLEKINNYTMPVTSLTSTMVIPGYSGGPVLDSNGNLLGIVIAYNKAKKTAFMVPTRTCERLLETLKLHLQ